MWRHTHGEDKVFMMSKTQRGQRRDPEAGGAPGEKPPRSRLSPKPRWPVGKRGSADRAGGRKGGDRGPRGAIAMGGDARVGGAGWPMAMGGDG